MAAKRELSSTLRNLKFMQRAAVAQKVEEKPKVEAAAAEEEEVVTVPSGGVGSSVKVARKCVVIMEGNPHPGAAKGRMSFLNFNPSIDVRFQDYFFISCYLQYCRVPSPKPRTVEINSRGNGWPPITVSIT
jgi:hypothetical protein